MFVLTPFGVVLGPVAGSRLTIDERQSLQMVGHERLASRDPDMAQSGDVLSLLFKRLQSFFLWLSPRPRRTRQTVAR